MKLKSILAGAFSLMLMASCSDANEPVPDNPGTTSGDNFLAVRISNSLDSRAEDGDFEYGTQAEATITKLRFYFFKDGEPANVGGTGQQNFADVTVTIGQPSAPEEGKQPGNIENTANVEVPLYCADGKTFDKTSVNQIVVIANPDKAQLPTGNSVSLSTLKALAPNYSMETTNAGDFVMTNSVYASSAGNTVCEVPVSAGNFIEKKDNQISGEVTPVDVYIERVVAKVRANFAWNGMTTIAGITLNGQTGLTAVKLTEKQENGDLKAITVDGKDLYAIFTGWNVIGLTDKSYLFKQITPGWSFTPTWSWNVLTNHRSHWAINPEDVNISDATSWGTLSTSYGNDGAMYIQENAADHSNATTGEKASQNTIAVFGAVLATLGEDNVPTPVTLVKFNNGYRVKADAINELYSSMSGKPYIATETQNQYTDDIRPYIDFKEITETVAGNEETKVYLQLTAAAENITFYKEIEGKNDENVNAADNIYSKEEVNAKLKALGSVEVANNGMTYYSYPINHLGTTGADGKNYGAKGIVRNHLYDIKITQVYGPGNFVFNPSTPSVSVVSHSFGIKANINVLSWKVVLNDNVILDWGSAKP